MSSVEVVMQQTGTRAGLEQTIRETQQAARDAAQDARTAAQNAKDALREARSAQPSDVAPPARAPAAPGTIVFPNDAGEDIQISVDGRGIHVRQGESSTIIPIHDVVPRGAVQITYGVFGSLAFMVVGYPLARAFARWLDRRGSATRLSGEVQQRLDSMDRNIDTVAVELERVAEGQRFTAKLLDQRPLEHAQRIDR